MVNRLIKIITTFFIGFGILAFAFIVNGATERIIFNKQVKSFMQRGEFIPPNAEYNYDENKYRLYRVSKKFDYEDNVEHIYTESTQNIGTTGDILITNRNPVPNIKVLNPIMHFFWLGHSALVIDDEGDEILEIVGNDTLESNEVQASYNDFSSFNTGDVIGLRVKGITKTKKDELLAASEKYYGMGYNFLFVYKLATRYYCIDLISKIYSDVNINVNHDFWVTTGLDMIVSRKTYIIYYSYVDKDGVMHKYFLD